MSEESKVTLYPSPGAKLAKALSIAQGKIKPPLKNRNVDFTHNGKRTKYSYADLADVIAAVQPHLTESELAVTHLLEYSQVGYGLKTLLIHSSGEFIETWYPLPDPAKQQIRAQEFGSALTYARRYSLSSLIGIAADEDDDGAIAAETPLPVVSQTKPKPIPNLAPKPQEPPPDDFDQYMDQSPPDYEGGDTHRELVEYVKARQIPVQDVKKVIKMYCGGIEKRSEEMTIEELQGVLKHLKTTRR